VYFWLLAVGIGLLAGLLTPACWWVVLQLRTFLGGVGEGTGSPMIWFGVPIGVALFIFLLFLGFRGFRSADGFTYFISDLHFQDGRRKLRYSLLHGIAALAMKVGQGLVGIEAFCMEILSAAGSSLAQRFRLSANQVRALAACGATAAIAAVLGQPAAAFLFVVELLYGWGSISFSVGAFALTAIVASSVSQSLTSPNGLFASVVQSDGGLSMALRSESFQLGPLPALAAVVMVGLSSGFLAIGTLWLYRRTDQELHRLLGTKKGQDLNAQSFALRIAIWSLLTGFALWQFPAATGTGIAFLHESLSQSQPWVVIGLVLLARVLLAAISYSALGSMGLILPILVGGSLLGAFLAPILQSQWQVSSATIALLAMGGYFSAIFGTPIAATVLVVGYSSYSDSAIFLFTALAINFVAHYLVGLFHSDRLATLGLYRHGIRFRNGMCFNTLSGIEVRDAMLTSVSPIPFSSSLGEAYRRLVSSKYPTLPVVAEDGILKGVVSLADFYGLDAWRRLGEESQVHALVGVEELVKPTPAELRPEMNLETALGAMTDSEFLPVVDQSKRYVGVLLRSDLVNLYNKEVVTKALRKRKT
jgi:chloride channel protein, CIC family